MVIDIIAFFIFSTFVTTLRTYGEVGYTMDGKDNAHSKNFKRLTMRDPHFGSSTRIRSNSNWRSSAN